MSVSAQEDGRNRNIDPDVVFWAERSDSFHVRSAILTILFLSPLALLAPAAFIVGFSTIATLAWWNRRAFRLQLTRSDIRFRPSALWHGIRIPLTEITQASTEEEPAGGFLPGDPRAGRVLLHLKSGLVLPIAGIVDAAEVARAVLMLKRQDGDTRDGFPSTAI